MKLETFAIALAAFTLAGTVIIVNMKLDAKEKVIAAQKADIARLGGELASAKTSLINAQASIVIDTKYIDRVKVVREKAKVITHEIPVPSKCEDIGVTYNAWLAGLDELRGETPTQP